MLLLRRPLVRGPSEPVRSDFFERPIVTRRKTRQADLRVSRFSSDVNHPVAVPFRRQFRQIRFLPLNSSRLVMRALLDDRLPCGCRRLSI
jgi:hypothetical protein